MHTKAFFLIVFILGLLVGYSAHFLAQSSTHDKNTDASCEYDLINPHFCTTQKGKKFIHQAHLTAKISDIISSAKSQRKVSKAGVFFRDLDYGPTVFIDADDKYYAGSLLKVPIMLMYLKYIDNDKSILDRKIHIDNSIPETQLKDKNHAAQRGNSYSVRELIEKMIIYSDNSSKNALRLNSTSILGGSANLGSIYAELGLQAEADDAGLLSLREYASVFRTLYNAQFLSPEMSQFGLDILLRSDFDHGIAAGVPQGVMVANKFGIPPVDDPKSRQLHDCGIVYHKNGNYILCIFTEGAEYAGMEEIIAQISKEVYKAVDNLDP